MKKIEKKDIIIVSKNDEIIGYKKRGTLDLKDMYRVSALWLINSKGEILLAQRAFTKKHYPGVWGPAVAGTIEKGETYESNIIKEIEEEIGIKNTKPIKINKVIAKSKYNHFTQWFLLKMDKNIDEFIKQDEEVEDLKWFSKNELLNEFEKNPDMFLKSINENFLLDIKY